MFSRWFEIAADRSGRPERSDDSEPRVARHGRGVGEQNSPLAVSWKRGHPVRRRPEHAVAAGARVEKGQYLTAARKFHC